jgi:hypothetical protein
VPGGAQGRALAAAARAAFGVCFSPSSRKKDDQRVVLLGPEEKTTGATMKTLSKSSWLVGAATTGLLLGAAPGARADAPPAPAASLGTLEYGANLYYPQGCQHNGSTVVCTFAFVHQAETQTVRAGGGGSQLSGIQFIDDAHVPHKPSNAYFVDRYGARQHALTLNRADQGTMMVEFPLVDARVTSGQLQLGTQVLAGIPVTAVGAAAPAAASPPPGATGAAAPVRTAAATAPAAAPAAGPSAAAAPAAAASTPTATPIPPASAASSTVQNTCNTPQMAKMTGCKLDAKIHQAEVNSTNQATSIAAPISAVGDAAKQLSGLFGSFSKKPATAPAAPAQPAQAPTQTQ